MPLSRSIQRFALTGKTRLAMHRNHP